jgi:hypothetical protein
MHLSFTTAQVFQAEQEILQQAVPMAQRLQVELEL